MTRHDAIVAGWCILTVLQTISARAAIAVRDAWADANPWALSTAMGAIGATGRIVWELAR